MTSAECELQELLDQLRDGDQQALAELFTHYSDQLRRMIALRLDHRLNGRVSPSDVLQEAYIDALKRVPHYLERPELPFLGFLRLVVGQRLVDVHREHLGAQRRDARQEVSLSQGMPAVNSQCLAALLAGHLTSPSQAAMRNESLLQLEEALNQLEPLDREVLVLRHFEELSNQEVAELLGIQKAAASKRYVRALVRLREVMTTLSGALASSPGAVG